MCPVLHAPSQTIARWSSEDPTSELNKQSQIGKQLQEAQRANNNASSNGVENCASNKKEEARKRKRFK
jgi:hypothetical protein